ncbi:MAG: peptide chain release factor N(5)-glutamine methyltransferase [Spirochaetales bacterium]|nr:peptide chain release factor N(5)-glutamine methyltransferase [Spirochaetales bacterium]
MQIRELLQIGTQKLTKISETPKLDSDILLGFILKKSRANLLASYMDSVTPDETNKYLQLLEKRAMGYPVAYILNEKEFYGLTFYVEDGVLTPRPDTEILVETAINLITKFELNNVLDMCTGTGCIAITIKNEIPKINVTAADISPISKRVFEINNAKITNNSVNFIQSNLFTKLNNDKFDIIVTNPPYLTKKETEERVNEGWKEPVLALDGGDDGLDLIREIIQEAPKHLTNNGWLLIEADPGQMENMRSLMYKQSFKDITLYQDLVGLNRIIVGRYEQTCN